MGLSTFLAPVAPDEPSLLIFRQEAASRTPDDVGDEVEVDDDEWEASEVGRAFAWFSKHPEGVELARFAPDVARALGESSDEVWIWADGAEMLDPETQLSYLEPDATRRVAELIGSQSAAEWNANLDQAIERETLKWEVMGELPPAGFQNGRVRTGAELAAHVRTRSKLDRSTVLEIAAEVQTALRNAADRGWGILSHANV